MESLDKQREALFGVSPPQQVSIRVPSGGVSATQINLDFHTPNTNQPNSYGNVVYIWQSGNQVPWGTPALNKQVIGNNSPSGSVSFTGLDVTTLSYIIGYSVGPETPNAAWTKYANVVATDYVPAIGTGTPTEANDQQVKPSVGVQSLGSTSLVSNIFLPSGFNPVGSGTWVGIWRGGSVSQDPSTKPQWRSASTNSSGDNTTVSFNNIALTRGTQYTLGLFSTGFSDDDSKLKQSALAATYSFAV